MLAQSLSLPVDPLVVEPIALFRVDGMYFSPLDFEDDVVAATWIDEPLDAKRPSDPRQSGMLPHHQQVLAPARPLLDLLCYAVSIVSITRVVQGDIMLF